jgi:hypothetical protein
MNCITKLTFKSYSGPKIGLFNVKQLKLTWNESLQEMYATEYRASFRSQFQLFSILFKCYLLK